MARMGMPMSRTCDCGVTACDRVVLHWCRRVAVVCMSCIAKEYVEMSTGLFYVAEEVHGFCRCVSSIDKLHKNHVYVRCSIRQRFGSTTISDTKQHKKPCLPRFFANMGQRSTLNHWRSEWSRGSPCRSVFWNMFVLKVSEVRRWSFQKSCSESFHKTLWCVQAWSRTN